MATRTLKTTVAVRDLIRHMHPALKRKVRAALADILDNPNCGKPLKGELSGMWSLRLGRHRVIHRHDANGAEIVAIGPRRTIYEETAGRVLRGQAIATRAPVHLQNSVPNRDQRHSAAQEDAGERQPNRPTTIKD